MRVAVIGVGNVGGALASALTAAGHDVVVAASNSETAAEAAAGLECEPAPSPREAADGADAVVLAIPFKAGHEVADEIREQVAGKPIVDVTNSPAIVEEGTSNAEAKRVIAAMTQTVKETPKIVRSGYALHTSSG